MTQDPLEQLKREIEEEVTGRRYVHPMPKARFELDRLSVPRGENLSGVLGIRAGRKELWLDRLDLLVTGVAKTTGSLHTSTALLLTRNVSVPAGESRQFPVWVTVPPDTLLGTKMVMLKDSPVVAMESFVVEPEALYSGVALAFASVAGLELQAWRAAKNGVGVVARLVPVVSERRGRGSVELEMSLQGDALEGALCSDGPSLTRKDMVRSLLFGQTRLRLPFSVPTDPAAAAEQLLAMLQAHTRGDMRLPIPAQSDAAPGSGDDLPVPATVPPRLDKA